VAYLQLITNLANVGSGPLSPNEADSPEDIGGGSRFAWPHADKLNSPHGTSLNAAPSHVSEHKEQKVTIDSPTTKAISTNGNSTGGAAIPVAAAGVGGIAHQPHAPPRVPSVVGNTTPVLGATAAGASPPPILQPSIIHVRASSTPSSRVPSPAPPSARGISRELLLERDHITGHRRNGSSGQVNGTMTPPISSHGTHGSSGGLLLEHKLHVTTSVSMPFLVGPLASRASTAPTSTAEIALTTRPSSSVVVTIDTPTSLHPTSP
jgi:hypothetical protein